MMSAVAAGLAYGVAENKDTAERARFEELAMRACLDLGPPKQVQSIEDIRAAHTLLDLCNFAHGALVEAGKKRVG